MFKMSYWLRKYCEKNVFINFMLLFLSPKAIALFKYFSGFVTEYNLSKTNEKKKIFKPKVREIRREKIRFHGFSIYLLNNKYPNYVIQFQNLTYGFAERKQLWIDVATCTIQNHCLNSQQNPGILVMDELAM